MLSARCTDKKVNEVTERLFRKYRTLDDYLRANPKEFELEIKPTGKTSGEIVWEWHAWDHLVQDVDRALPNYGEVSEHPERIDVNYGSREFDRAMADPQQLA